MRSSRRFESQTPFRSAASFVAANRAPDQTNNALHTAASLSRRTMQSKRKIRLRFGRRLVAVLVPTQHIIEAQLQPEAERDAASRTPATWSPSKSASDNAKETADKVGGG